MPADPRALGALPHHSTDAARDALSRLVDAAYGHGQRSCFSIPPREDRDADLILESVITERDALRAERDATARVVAAARALVAALPHCHGECDPPGVAVRLAEDGDEYCEACVERYGMHHTSRLDWHAELPAAVAALAALDAPRDGAA